jgi:hypothetical protein
MATNFSVFGTEVMLARLKKMRTDVPKELNKALYREAQAIFRKSQRLVPVDKGFLKGSGVVEGPTNNEVLIGYGGPAAPYALYVHEDPDAQHAKGKTYKFLEIPLMEARPGMEKRLADALDRAAEGKDSGDAAAAEGQSADENTEVPK